MNQWCLFRFSSFFSFFSLCVAGMVNDMWVDDSFFLFFFNVESLIVWRKISNEKWTTKNFSKYKMFYFSLLVCCFHFIQLRLRWILFCHTSLEDHNYGFKKDKNKTQPVNHNNNSLDEYSFLLLFEYSFEERESNNDNWVFWVRGQFLNL